MTHWSDPYVAEGWQVTSKSDYAERINGSTSKFWEGKKVVIDGKTRYFTRKTNYIESKEEKTLRKLNESVTIYGDDSAETAAAKMAVAQKRQAAITMGGFTAEKAILEDKPMSWVQDQLDQLQAGTKTGNLLKLVGVGTGAALVGATAAVLLTKMKQNGGGNMGVGTTYAAVDEYLGGYLPGGITPGVDNALEAQAGIVKRYSTPNGTLYRFANGKMGMVSRRTGLLKVWKPYRCIVIGKRPTIGQLSRVVKRAKVWQKGLNKLLK